jgi:hypothetical protein
VSERISLLVTVKAYPAISQRYNEVVCVAGVRTDTLRPEWIRLFPVAFRELPFDQRFKKYQHISLEASRHTTDRRPETYRPNLDTLELGEVLDTRHDRAWSARRALVDPLEVESMCEALDRQRKGGSSLAVIRPGEVLDFLIDKETTDWSRDKAEIVAQPSLFFPSKKGLERIPYRFRYQYRCSKRCKGHVQSIVDWELAAAFREWPYPERERLEKIRELWLGKMCAGDRDTRFFVGNQHQYLEAFLVLGVFWPPRLD